MAIEYRQATAEEMGQFGALTEYVYAGAFGAGDDNLSIQATQADWTICAFDGSKLVASYATIPFTMRANGNAMPLGGVTTVGTLPEYRRQGLLRGMTERAFFQQHEAGQSISALWASQAAIYQRYGYAAGSVMGNYAIDTADIRLLQEADSHYNVARCSIADGFEELRNIYREFITERTLYLHRAKPLWNYNILQATDESGPVHAAICRNSMDEPVGYVIYTLRAAKVSHEARNQELEIRDFAWLDLDACRALWSFIARHDLVGRVTWRSAPRDDPLPELLSEPRMLHAQHKEGVWFRILDVEKALTERGYSNDGQIVIGVTHDPLAPWNEGNYELSVKDGTAKVSGTSSAAEVTFSIKTLASAFSGFRRVRELAGWGLIDVREDALGRADALFATAHAPHCPNSF